MGWLQKILVADGLACEHALRTIMEPAVLFQIGPIPVDLEPFGQFQIPPFPVEVKLLIGVGMWFSMWYFWLFKGPQNISIFWTKAVMVLGVDLAALSSLQMFQTRGFFAVGFMVLCNVRWAQVVYHEPDLAAPEGDETNNFTVNSLFENIFSDQRQLIMVFCTQSILFIFFLFASFIKYTDSTSITYGFFLVGYQVQMAGMFGRGKEAQIGRPWNIQRWRGMLRMNRNVEYQQGENWVSVDQWNMEVRNVMGFIVNTIYRDFIAFLTPIVLMQSEGAMDFVQNCFAVTYITTLDDLSDELELVNRLRPGRQNQETERDLGRPLLFAQFGQHFAAFCEVLVNRLKPGRRSA